MKTPRFLTTSDAAHRLLGSLISGYLRVVWMLSRWERQGFEEMDAAVAAGEPVIIVTWHQRLIMAPFAFPPKKAPICALTSAARGGRMAGQVMVSFGMSTVPMKSRERHVVLSREIMRRIKAGSSIAIAADGPKGPPRILSGVPIQWARTSGLRVFCISFSATRLRAFSTWDKMILPRPFSKGTLTCQEWTGSVPRRASDVEIESARRDLQEALDQTTDASDLAAGQPPGPRGTGTRAPEDT